MWQPEVIRTLVSMGAEVILHPTLSGAIYNSIEYSIKRAMAAMNQCIFFDVNGIEAGGSGKSLVVDARGDVLYEADEEEEVFPLELDLGVVRRMRHAGSMQLLKSFRDNRAAFSMHRAAGHTPPYLETLGALIKPSRPTVAHLAELKMAEPRMAVSPVRGGGKAVASEHVRPGALGAIGLRAATSLPLRAPPAAMAARAGVVVGASSAGYVGGMIETQKKTLPLVQRKLHY